MHMTRSVTTLPRQLATIVRDIIDRGQLRHYSEAITFAGGQSSRILNRAQMSGRGPKHGLWVDGQRARPFPDSTVRWR